MTFTWNGTTLDCAEINAPNNVSGSLEQSGQILRTISGLGKLNRVYSKWSWSVGWENSPTEIQTKMEAMIQYNGTVYMQDTIIGNFYVDLTQDDLEVHKTDFGICTVNAVFREV